MSLQTLMAHTLQGVTGKIKRNAIAYSVCGLCALAVLVLATVAGVLALVPVVGPVYALLIVAGIYLAIIVGTMIWLRNTAPRPAARVTATPTATAALGVSSDATANPRQMQFAQLAMIIEAVALGYSLSRKR
jgi:O-antigen ligase